MRSTDQMRRALAEWLQQDGSSPPLGKRLAQLAARHRAGTKPAVVAHSFKTGSLLQREWHGGGDQVELLGRIDIHRIQIIEAAMCMKARKFRARRS